MASEGKNGMGTSLTLEELRPFFRTVRRALLMLVRAVEQLYPDGLE